MAKNLYMVSLGCPKNLVDSEIMLALLAADGYQICQDPDQADLLLVNTCGFIQPAVEEAIDEIIRLGQYKDKKPGVKLVVTGCLVQRYGKELPKEFPEVDLFIGVDGFHNITALVADPDKQQNRLIIPAQRFLMNSTMPRKVSTPPHRAYLKISEGCSNRCSYCLIPSIRGPQRSRSMADLAGEAARLAEAGVRELTLVGQDVTAYGIDLGGKQATLPALITTILDACTADWLRLLYLYPNRISHELLSLMAQEDRLLNYLDIPLQHISSRVLKKMNRPFTSRQVHELLDRIRSRVPEAAIRTTFIVGFPGETDQDVEELAAFLQTYRLNNVGIFTYANEEGCAAEHFADQCPEESKQQRHDYLMEMQAQISLEKNQELVGRTLPVLVEGLSQETDLLLEGRTQSQAPDIDGCVYITDGQCAAGEIVMVKITEAHPYDLVGVIAGSSQDA
ncbi:MAG: 30S ribosomal protein S12 methylthiotransferase RimO [Desulfobulbaceae bacterium]|nr:30S ribosomal protein S12 methylthiotransferase RimO [Desulfobulbaceae bacterium]